MQRGPRGWFPSEKGVGWTVGLARVCMVGGEGDASVDTSVAALTVKAVLPPCTREKERERGREGKMMVG